MLEKPFEWDTAQMPINVLDAHYRSFQKVVLPKCTQKNVSVIGMKSLGCGIFPREIGLNAAICRRFALSLPISTLVCGITSRENLQQDLAVARDFQPMTVDEVSRLLAETKEAGKDGRYERFKTTVQFDGLYHRRQHGV